MFRNDCWQHKSDTLIVNSLYISPALRKVVCYMLGPQMVCDQQHSCPLGGPTSGPLRELLPAIPRHGFISPRIPTLKVVCCR
jgi:hypothetical protein